MATFDANQIDRYLSRIGLEPSAHKQDASALAPEDALEYLKLLMKAHLVKVPFENLSLHYSRSGISLDPSDLFRKIVETSGRGGYCMENTFEFSVLLTSLGFNLYTAAGRVWVAGLYTGW
jgi:arylamine N-acetyltransferase